MKKSKPNKIILPDNSPMLEMIPYLVKLTRDIDFPPAKIHFRKGDQVSAILIEEKINLCITLHNTCNCEKCQENGSNQVPTLGIFYMDAKIGKDFELCDLIELPDNLLQWKYDRMEEVENYEMCAKIKKEMERRELLRVKDPQMN